MGALPQYFIPLTAFVDSSSGTIADSGVAIGTSFMKVNSCIYMQGDNTCNIVKNALALATASTQFGIQTVAEDPGNTFFELIGDQGQTLMRLNCTNGNGYYEAEYWDGAAFVQFGSEMTNGNYDTVSPVVITVDWNIADSGGYFRVYANDDLQMEFTGDTLTDTDTEIETVRLSVPGNNSTDQMYIFGWNIDSASRVRKRVEEKLAASNTYVNGWSGGESEIDEYAGAPGNSNFMSSNTDGAEASFGFNAIHADWDEFDVDGVIAVLTAKANSDPGFYIKPFYRDAANTGYLGDGASIQPVAAGFASYMLEFDANPAGGEWDVAAFDAGELGFRLSSTA